MDAQRIKDNWIFLKENLVQHEIRDFFIDEHVWDLSNIEDIDAEKTPKEKNERFLKLLLQSDQKAYEVFTLALQEKCSTHIIEKLRNTPSLNDSDKSSGKQYNSLCTYMGTNRVFNINFIRDVSCLIILV